MTHEAQTLFVEREGPVARLWLNRPQARNAMNWQMIEELHDYFTSIRVDPTLRVVVLGGQGATFCTGGDLKEIRESAVAGDEEQLARVLRGDAMFQAVREASQVIIARVHGPAMGGGLGLVAVSDLAIAAHRAQLGLPEARLGLVPALISPYLVARIGAAKTRELMLTGATLDGNGALAAGLLTATCTASELDDYVDSYVRQVLQCGPRALAECKALLLEIGGKAPSESAGYRAALFNRVWGGEEAQAGIDAFLEKRPAPWAES